MMPAWHQNARARTLLNSITPRDFSLRWSLNIGTADGYSLRAETTRAIRAECKLNALREGWLTHETGTTAEQALAEGEQTFRARCELDWRTASVEDVICAHFDVPFPSRFSVEHEATALWHQWADVRASSKKEAA